MKSCSHVSVLQFSPTQPSVEILHVIGKLVFFKMNMESQLVGWDEQINYALLEVHTSTLIGALLEVHDRLFPHILQCENPQPLTEPSVKASQRLLNKLALDPDQPDVVSASSLPDGIGDKFVESMRVMARLFAQATKGHTVAGFVSETSRDPPMSQGALLHLTVDGGFQATHQTRDPLGSGNNLSFSLHPDTSQVYPCPNRNPNLNPNSDQTKTRTLTQ